MVRAHLCVIAYRETHALRVSLHGIQFRRDKYARAGCGLPASFAFSLLLGNLELRDEEGQDSRCVHVTYVHSTVACFSDVQAVHIVKGALVKVFNTPVTLTVDFNSKNKGGSEVKLNKSAHCKCR